MSGSTRRKVVFIGLDAADGDLIRRWAADGRLPTFRRLFAQASWGRSLNPVGFYVGAIWPSFYTGLTPARHGRYCFHQVRTDSYGVYQFEAATISGTPVWTLLSRAGRRVAIIDMPKAALAGDLRGLQVADWGTHDPENGGFRTTPPELAATIDAEYGRDPAGICNEIERTPQGFQRFRDDLRDRSRRKLAMARHILERGEWDLLAVCFSEAHCVGHQCWHIHDASHIDHDPALREALGDPILDVYVALDDAVARLLDGIEDDTFIFILASHGMGPHYDGSHLLDRALRRIDKALPQGLPRQIGPWLYALAMARLRQRPWLRRIADALPAARPQRAFRKSFAVANNEAFAGIRLNLAGRERQGRIRPGSEQRDYCAALERELLALTSGVGRSPAFTKILRTADLYEGERLQELPDLLAEWSRERPFAALESATIGRIEGTYKSVRTGDHRPDGLFFALGPGVAAGETAAVSVMDFAPTFADILGVPMPDIDGKPIGALHTRG